MRGVLGFKRRITAATFHHGITSLIGCLKNTHPLTPGKMQSQMVVSHSLAIGRTGAKINATNGHLGNEKATGTQIAAINVDAMMTATVTTFGSRWRCPRTQEHRRGSRVAPDEPDKWLTMRTISAGGGHGLILFGKSEAGVNIPTSIYREFLTRPRFFTGV